jgi:hypothetical protein
MGRRGSVYWAGLAGLAEAGPVYGPVWSGSGNAVLLANMQKSPVWPVWGGLPIAECGVRIWGRGKAIKNAK